MNIKIINLLLCCTMLLCSCKKNIHDAGFEAESRVFFVHHNETDSLVYSFANYPIAENHDLLLPVQIMGNTTAHDRTVYVEIDRTETTAVDSEYEIADRVIIPAQTIRGTLVVHVKNTARLTTEKAVLKLKLKPSSDFIVEPIKVDKENELVELRVIWSNILIRPADWPSVWGIYSQAKHRLVIELTGQSKYSGTEWNSTGLTYSVMGFCNEWLENYKEENNGQGYLNENGKEIRLCPTCN